MTPPARKPKPDPAPAARAPSRRPRPALAPLKRAGPGVEATEHSRPVLAATKHSRPGLALAVQFADPTDRALLPRHRLRRWLAAALEGPAEITLRIVDEAEGRALNREFRAKDYATNVLTFDYVREPSVVADIVLCGPVLRKEAEAQGIDLEAHYAHLVVHGALHARGFDHEADLDAELMEAHESVVMTALGFADPYAR